MSRHGRYNHPPFRQKGTDIERRGYTSHVFRCVEGRSLDSWSSTTSLPTLCSSWFHSLYFIYLIHPFFYIETLTPLLAWHINKFPQNVYIHMCKDQHIFTHKHTLVHRYTHTPIHIWVLGRKHSKRILSCQWLRKSSNETMLHEYFHNFCMAQAFLAEYR